MKVILLSCLLSIGAPALAAPELAELSKALGGRAPESVAETPIADIYEVSLDGQVFYLSKDGRYVIQGEMIDLTTRANLTEQRRDIARKATIDNLNESEMIVFAPAKTPVNHTITIFTDIDCGYCRKMHQEIESYLDLGIKVRYMAFPRSGPNTDSFNKAVSVWCADDQQTAMTRAKSGQSVEAKTCPNPVNNQYELGQQLGIRGTPSILLESGEMIPGYMPAPQLAAALQNNK